MAAQGIPNVWTQMNYVPPRGRCEYKASYISAPCPCLRFMLHPLKSASSYDCDGCSHHASFHAMENKTEKEIQKRWELEAEEKQEQEEQKTGRPRKRLRELEYNAAAQENINDNLIEAGSSTYVRPRGGVKLGAKAAKPLLRSTKSTATRGAAQRANGRVAEMLEEEDDEFIELD